MNRCHYCGGSGEPDGLRPYGPGGTWTCYECGMKPENLATTEAGLHAVFNQAAAVTGMVKMTDRGPEPIVDGEDFANYTKDGAEAHLIRMEEAPDVVE